MPQFPGIPVIRWSWPWGTPHADDLVFFPNREAYPRCWVKLSDAAADKEDLLVKETLLYPHEQAQGDWRRSVLAHLCTSSGLGVAGRETPPYVAPQAMVFPLFQQGAPSHVPGLA